MSSLTKQLEQIMKLETQNLIIEVTTTVVIVSAVLYGMFLGV